MNIAKLLKTKTLDSPSARLDAELLLATVLNQPRSFLYAHPEYELTPTEEKKFARLYKRRMTGEPVAYILGKKEFWSIELKINSAVLIPRPETEILIEVALNKLPNESAMVADLGTGSGAIAIALAYERPKWNIIATDISKEALKVARYNARQLKLKNIKFYSGDWCRALPNQKLDLIVSNPPYIAQDDSHLQQKELKFEPKIALTASNGIIALQKIIVQAKKFLKPGGSLILEHGYDQSKKVKKLLQQNGYQKITVHKDLAGKHRVVAAEKN